MSKSKKKFEDAVNDRPITYAKQWTRGILLTEFRSRTVTEQNGRLSENILIEFNSPGMYFMFQQIAIFVAECFNLKQMSDRKQQ